ncbi:phasin family protein [Chitinilyticum litopenaei]|uniref:phasin family protein n=1 Tax=Chitinilyticum litopenaei TaxID=1121276 RepID=UPI0003F8A7BC|nr:phasin family protein [Chitinilyticum litopenaei]
MYNAQQFVDFNQANIEKTLRLTNIALAGAENLLQLQFTLARDLIAENVETAKALANARTAQDLADLQKTLAQPAVGKSLSLARTVFDAASNTQQEINKLVEEQVLEFNKNLLSSLDQAVQQTPASGAAVAVFKNVVETANTAYDALNKTAQRITGNIAEATVAAVETGAKAASGRKSA